MCSKGSCARKTIGAESGTGGEDEHQAGAALTYEVLNFSVSGYSTRDEAALLAGRVLDFEPDLVLVAYCLNDPEAGLTQPLSRRFAPRPLWHTSHLLRLIAKRRHEHLVETLGDGDLYRSMHAPEGSEWPDVLEAFERIRDDTQAHGIGVLVVVFPWPRLASWEEYPYRDVHEQVARAAEANGFEVLDLLAAFSRHDPNDVVFSMKDPHPTALGHRVAATAIEEWLRAYLP